MFPRGVYMFVYGSAILHPPIQPSTNWFNPTSSLPWPTHLLFLPTTAYAASTSREHVERSERWVRGLSGNPVAHGMQEGDNLVADTVPGEGAHEIQKSSSGRMWEDSSGAWRRSSGGPSALASRCRACACWAVGTHGGGSTRCEGPAVGALSGSAGAAGGEPTSCSSMRTKSICMEPWGREVGAVCCRAKNRHVSAIICLDAAQFKWKGNDPVPITHADTNCFMMNFEIGDAFWDTGSCIWWILHSIWHVAG
jgi:hypothetical protein